MYKLCILSSKCRRENRSSFLMDINFNFFLVQSILHLSIIRNPVVETYPDINRWPAFSVFNHLYLIKERANF